MTKKMELHVQQTELSIVLVEKKKKKTGSKIMIGQAGVTTSQGLKLYPAST